MPDSAQVLLVAGIVVPLLAIPLAVRSAQPRKVAVLASLITLVCIAVFFCVSYMTAPPAYARISGLTFATLTEADKAKTRSSWEARDVIWSLIVLGLILSAYLYFTG